CLLLVIGLVAAVNELQLQANATLMQNETAVQRVRAGTLDYGINCSVSRYIIFTSGEKPTLVAWEVAPDDGGVGSGSCHVYLPDRAGASDRNCARMSEQLGIRLGDADRPETGLKIGLVNASHGGWYKCRVYIDNLLYIGHTRLLVEDKPSAPTDLRLTPISSDTLVANWSPPASNGNLQLLRYELSGSGLRLNGSSKLKLLIGNLSPHKVYCLSVLAVNAAGRGPSTESVCNRTLEGSPEPGALRVELHSVNDTMAVLRFHIALDKMAGQFRLVRLEPRLLWHLEAPGRLSADRALTDLKPYSRYRLLYSVSNGAESGSAGSIDFNTTDGLAPAPTLLLYQLSIFDVNLTASCAPKGRVNGRFNGYRLFVYLQSNKSIVFERNFGPDAVNLSVTGLKPYTSYLLSAAIVTTRVGEESSPTPVLTDPGAPTAPINFTASPAKARAGLLLSWDHKPLRIRLWIQAVGKSSYDTEHRRYFGDRSEPADASVSISDYEAGGLGRAWSKFPGGRRKNGESATDNDDSNLSPAVAVGVVVGSIAAVLGVGFILLLGWRWIFVRHRGYQRPFSQGLETFECLNNEQGGHSSHSAGSSRAQLKRYSQTEHKAMSVAEFRDHVIASHANDNSAFQLEFEEIQRVTHKDWQAYHAKHPDNLSKNRYTDICPYDHSRVVLLSNPGKKMGDYINANYVDGYRRDKAYIACQGPVPSTFDDFWLMVWENRCTAIVMISNFVERGRRKCDQYWPSSGSEVYGAISVKLIRQLNKAAYCMREFSIRNLRAKKLAKERQLFHFHYSEWPDYGVPAYPLPVLNFVQRTAAYCGGDQSGPVVVHC
uniref:Protein-tyrosine-phosphatase n=1 Tax=Macrostomum lignano TaxID=282301 RepID=A0A1I8HPM1_9PLAT